VPEFSDVRQTEIHTAEPLVPETSAFEVDLAIGKLKRHISPGGDQILAELIKAGGRTLRCVIPVVCVTNERGKSVVNQHN